MLALLTLFGCGSADPGCVDVDGDGYGEGCELGADCDDTNAGRTLDCSAPPPDCTETPTATGCPCLAGTIECFDGDPELAGVGICVTGMATCRGGFWGVCEGGVAPRFESCDLTDQDCDGRVDEGVLSPCGGCTPGCVGDVWGEGVAAFEAGGGLALTDEGWLTLAREELASASVWVANSGEAIATASGVSATISQIDAESATEVGRYYTGGREPSRVAVDYLSDAWVANREFDGQSTVRKIAGSRERCVDRDDSGTLETSSGSEVLEDDECVLFTVDVGEEGEVARALAIDGNLGLDEIHGGNAWVGLHDGEAILELDGATGEVLDRIETPGFQPYAMAFDPWGRLWASSRNGLLLELDRRERPRVPLVREIPDSCYLAYGLAADRNGRVVMSGFACDRVHVFDAVTERWSTIATPASVRGAVVVDGEDAQEAWVAHTEGLVSRVRVFPLEVLDTFAVQGLGFAPFEAIGVGADSLGHVWVASSQSEEGGLSDGVATRLERDGEVTGQVAVGLAPHTQGDLTGGKRLGGFVEEGTQTHVFSGCPAEAETEWLRLHLVARRGTGGEVELAVRQAADEASLSGEFEVVATFPAEGGPYDIDVPDGGVVEVRLTLRTETRDGAPRVERVGIEWTCPGPD